VSHAGPERGQPREKPRECDRCRETKRDVRYDPGTRKLLCDACWFHTPPTFGGMS
jgi:hypothetical protein